MCGWHVRGNKKFECWLPKKNFTKNGNVLMSLLGYMIKCFVLVCKLYFS